MGYFYEDRLVISVFFPIFAKIFNKRDNLPY